MNFRAVLNLVLGVVPLLFSLEASATELDYGKGQMSVKGGFLGLEHKATDAVTVYTLKEQHRNLFGSRFFYDYRLSWYDSKEMLAGQQTYNNSANQINSWIGNSSDSSLTVPTMDYRMQGLDVNLAVGYDLIHANERNFLGLGVLAGLSAPWIESKKSSSDSSNSPLNIPDSKTEFWTYKIGPQLVGRKSLGQYFSVYGSAAYAFQTAHVKNKTLNVSADVNGHFITYDLGVRFQPYAQDFDLGWFTLSPRLYANAGIRNSYWSVDDVAIDVSGQNLPIPKSTLDFNASTAYIGVGYSF